MLKFSISESPNCWMQSTTDPTNTACRMGNQLAMDFSLAGAAFLSDVAAFEVLVAGLTDNTGLSRRSAVLALVSAAMVLALLPMLNMAIFVPWDLTFGSGMQTLGAFAAAVTVGWALYRGSSRGRGGLSGPLFLWIRYGVPVAIGVVGVFQEILLE